MDKERKSGSTFWFKANKSDARQIVERYHGRLPDAARDALVDEIWREIRGWPKKELCGVLNTVGTAHAEAMRAGEPFGVLEILAGRNKNRKGRAA